MCRMVLALWAWRPRALPHRQPACLHALCAQHACTPACTACVCCMCCVCVLRAACFVLRAACCVLRVACCVLCAAWLHGLRLWCVLRAWCVACVVCTACARGVRWCAWHRGVRRVRGFRLFLPLPLSLPLRLPLPLRSLCVQHVSVHGVCVRMPAVPWRCSAEAGRAVLCCVGSVSCVASALIHASERASTCVRAYVCALHAL